VLGSGGEQDPRPHHAGMSRSMPRASLSARVPSTKSGAPWHRSSIPGLTNTSPSMATPTLSSVLNIWPMTMWSAELESGAMSLRIARRNSQPTVRNSSAAPSSIPCTAICHARRMPNWFQCEPFAEATAVLPVLQTLMPRTLLSARCFMKLSRLPWVRGLHSSTLQLNLSALYEMEDLRKGLCSPCQGGFRGCLGCVG